MNKKKAREILGSWIQPDGRLYGSSTWLRFIPGNGRIDIDASLDADDLEAIAWWMRNQNSKLTPK